MDTSSVAGLDKELDIGLHEWDRHGNVRSVREDKVGVLSKLFDDAENVIPPSTVQSRAVAPEFIDNLIHLKDRQNGLNQHSPSNGSSWNSDSVLSKIKHIVPEAGFKVGFHLGEVKVWSMTTGSEFFGIVEEVKTKVKERAGDGLVIDGEVLLLEMPASWSAIVLAPYFLYMNAGSDIPDDESRQRTVGTELVVLAIELKVNLPSDRIIQIDLTINHIIPCWRAGICINISKKAIRLNPSH